MAYLDSDTFATIVEYTPLVSIDLIIRNHLGEILLGRRVNAPAQGFWFTPGGRIYKGEKISDAFTRIAYEETGIQHSIESASFLGTFEHFYPDSVFGSHIATHYIVLAYEIHSNLPLTDLPAAQHHEYCWWSIGNLINDEAVHTHVKWYFD